MMRKSTIAISIAWLALAGAALADDLSKFPLSAGVPEDVFIVVAGRQNPKRAFLDKYWQDVFQAFQKCGVTEELWGLIESSVSAEDRERVEEALTKIRRLGAGVEWGELFGGDTVYMGRQALPTWENCLLTRNSAASAERNFRGLAAILREIARTVGSPAAVEESEIEGAKVLRLSFAPEVPIGISVARRKDVIALGIGDALLRDSLGMLAGRSEKTALTATKRFKSALAMLPPPEDQFVFFDASRMMGDMRTTFVGLQQMAAGARTRPAEDEQSPDDPSAAVFAVIEAVLNDAAIIDYSMTTARTEGFRVIEDTVTTLSSDAKKRAGYEIFVRAHRFEKLDRLVPKEATAFSVSEGFNFLGLYDWGVRLMQDRVPGGREMLSQWEDFQEQNEFNLRDDVLVLLSGPSIEVTFGGGGQAQSVTMLKVSDSQRAEKVISDLIQRLNALLGPQQGLMISTVNVPGGGKFNSVGHPMMMMMQMKPIVWGTANDHLIFGTDAQSIGMCLKTMAGKHPGISENPRFAAEGVIPKGAFASASFNDTSRTAEELGAMLAGFSMASGMVGAFAQIPDEQGGRILKAVPSITGKLARVAGRLNFFQSDSSVTTFDGKAWKTTTYTNYKDPKSLTATTDDEPAGDEDENGEE